MSNQSIQTLKGFRDFLPSDMAIRKEAIRRLSTVFEKYGFNEIATPALEYDEILTGKYGEEAEKLMYLFEDPGERKVGLKYDLTVPLARVIANNPQLPVPFKRYQIQPVWRAENTQKGRYREFYQCDIDIIGSASPISDAEILAVISDSVKILGLENFVIKVNSRQVLFSIMEKSGISKDLWLTAIQTIDKLDKKEKNEIEEELINKGLTIEQVSSIFSLLTSAKPDKNLQEILEYAKELGVTQYEFDPAISRGLDYYTGAIFETTVTDFKIGSITGGGRYDELLKKLGGPNLPAVGTTIGLERIIDVISEQNLWEKVETKGTKVLVTVFNEKLLPKSIKAATNLRNSNINTELYSETTAKIDKQLKYANKLNIPYVVIIGEEESLNNEVLLKNMATGEQSKCPLSEIAKFIN